MNEVSQSVSPSQTARQPAREVASPLLMACCLALAPATAIGFGRFAYALVLPAMQSDLQLSYAQAGTLNTANMVGYLLGALLAMRTANRVAPRTALLAGLAVSVVALLLAGFTNSYLGLIFCRAFVGTAAAFTFIASTSLAAHLGRDEAESTLALSLAIGGPGVGSILAGLVVPFLLTNPSHWPLAWRFLGGVGALVWFVVWLGTRALQSQVKRAPTAANEAPPQKADYSALLLTFIAYFLFGLGYIAYMTFLVAFVHKMGASAATVAIIWSSLGCAMVASTFVWRRPLTTERSGRTLALMGVGGAFAAALPLVSRTMPVLLVSAVLFGITTMPVFTAVTLLIRRFLPPAAWARAIAVGTVIFAMGQSLGPIGSGYVSDRFGPGASLVWSLAILLVAAGVAGLQKPAPKVHE